MIETVRQRINAIQPLLKDTDSDVRSAAALAIERLEGTTGLEEILASLKKGDLGTKIRAIYALGEIGGEQVLAPLSYCAGRPEDTIRSAAVQVLGKLVNPAAIPVLAERLNDTNPAIRARALAALAKFPPNPELAAHTLRFIGENDGILEAEAVLALGRLGSGDMAERITPLLSSEHASTRAAAATALSVLSP